jgi:hypothetical protein
MKGWIVFQTRVDKFAPAEMVSRSRIHKGGVDYVDINARMASDNRTLGELTVEQL